MRAGAKRARGLWRVLGERPEGFTAEEWRVVLAILSPDEPRARRPDTATASPPRGRRPRSPGRWHASPACLPWAALRAFREASAVATCGRRSRTCARSKASTCSRIAHTVRARLLQVAALADDLRDDGGQHGPRGPSGAAKVGLAVVAACKGLMDLDALKAPPIPADDAPPPENGERTGDHLKALLRRTHDDLASRRRDVRTLPLIESTAGDAPSGETC